MDTYEKKYKEALGKAEEFYNDKDNIRYANAEGMLEEIFPELAAESEDEKIRKVLVELVKCNERCGYFMINNTTTSAMLAWLEKQGGVSPNLWHDASESPNKKDVCLIMNDRQNGITLSNCEIVISNPQTRNFVTRSYPHPTGRRHTIHGENDVMVEEYHSERDHIPFSDVDKWCYLEDLLDEKQKPAWSEEDEKEYKCVLRFVDNILNNCGNKKDYEHCKRCYDWLKSIKDKIKKEAV